MKNLPSLLFRFSLCLMVLPLLVANTQAQTHGNKFLRSENPISGQYIVVLTGAGLSQTPEESTAEMMSVESGSTEASDNERESTSKAADGTVEIQSDAAPAESGNMEPTPLLDPELVSLAIDLTRIYGGQFMDTYGSTGKGFLLRATEDEALAISQDSRVLFVQEDGEIKIGAIQLSLPSPGVESIHRLCLPPSSSVAAAIRKSVRPRMTYHNAAVNLNMNARLFSKARVAETHNEELL